ncbi:MAG TPA: phosphatase PAP2 family protein [Gaiellaceae bacterium]|nr:phosphatase PAP2 family protein [Gaiellaceae bacterium]
MAIWSGFAFAYVVVRGFADRSAETALANGRAILQAERWLHLFFEQRLQHALLGLGGLITLLGWTYWLSQFVVVSAVLLWIYLRHYDSYFRLRNALIIANTIGLVIYIVVPSAPPRLLPGLVEDTLAASGALRHGSGFVTFAENPYAAMPSLHAADALLIGIALAIVVRRLWLKALWLLWPAWVAFALVVTGNHFWLDIAAGALLVAVALPVSGALERRRVVRSES